MIGYSVRAQRRNALSLHLQTTVFRIDAAGHRRPDYIFCQEPSELGSPGNPHV
jgi:hypothetical protein